MIDTKPLRHLLAVAQHPSVQAAADALHITQPALTKSIGRFEEAIGEKLFDRRGHRLVLTELGQRLVTRANSLIRQMGDLEEEIQLWKGIGIGEVNIGVDPSAELSLLPQVLDRFASAYQGVEVQIHTGHTQTLLPRLLHGELHFIVADPEVARERDDLEIASLARSELVAAVSVDHPLAEVALPDPDAVLACAFVGASPAPRFKRWREERGEEIKGTAFKPWVVCDNYEVLVRLAEKTGAIVFIPENVSADYEKSGRLAVLSLPLNSPIVEIGLIMSGGRALSPAARKLANLFKDMASDSG